MDKWKLSRKRRVEKTFQAEHQVQRTEDAGRNPEQASSSVHLPQTTEWRLEGAATPGEPHQPSERSYTPRFHFPRWLRGWREAAVGSLGQLLHVRSSLVSNETDRFYRWKVRKYQSAQSRKKEMWEEQRRSEHYWFPFWRQDRSRSCCLVACPRISISWIHQHQKSDRMFSGPPQTVSPFLLHQNWGNSLYKVQWVCAQSCPTLCNPMDCRASKPCPPCTRHCTGP